MRIGISVIAISAMLLTIAGCPAMARDVSMSDVHADHAADARSEQANGPMPECCLNAPQRQAEPGVTMSVWMPLWPDAVLGKIVLEPIAPRSDFVRNEARSRDPDPKFEFRSKAKRE